jgi:hypothetical protein
VKLTPEQKEAVHKSRQRVNAVRRQSETTGTATEPATATAPTTQQRVEIIIDPQLEKALEIMRNKLGGASAKTARSRLLQEAE